MFQKRLVNPSQKEKGLERLLDKMNVVYLAKGKALSLPNTIYLSHWVMVRNQTIYSAYAALLPRPVLTDEI